MVRRGVEAVVGSGEAPAYIFTHNLHPNLFGWPPESERVDGVQTPR